MYAVYQVLDLSGKPRRPIKTAALLFADTGTQQPKEAADVIHMGVTDEDIANLMCYSPRQSRSIAKIEQQAASLIRQAEV
jgi:hypothetical protein